jgi:hypothetical protein
VTDDSTADDISGLPDPDAPEPPPLGPTEDDLERETGRGEDAMPGIPTEGEPPTSG